MSGDYEVRVMLRREQTGDSDPVVVSTQVVPSGDQDETAALRAEVEQYRQRVGVLEGEVARLNAELQTAWATAPEPAPAAARPAADTPAPAATPTPTATPAPTPTATPVAAAAAAPAALATPIAAAAAQAAAASAPQANLPPPPPRVDVPSAPPSNFNVTYSDGDPTAAEIAAMRSPTHAVTSFVRRALGMQGASGWVDTGGGGSAFDSPAITDTHLLLPQPWYKKIFK